VTYVDSTIRPTQSWGNVGVLPGEKPVTPDLDLTNDPGYKTIRDLFPLDDDS